MKDNKSFSFVRLPYIFLLHLIPLLFSGFLLLLLFPLCPFILSFFPVSLLLSSSTFSLPAVLLLSLHLLPFLHILYFLFSSFLSLSSLPSSSCTPPSPTFPTLSSLPSCPFSVIYSSHCHIPRSPSPLSVLFVLLSPLPCRFLILLLLFTFILHPLLFLSYTLPSC